MKDQYSANPDDIRQDTGEILLRKQYTIPFTLFKAAFTAFQKKFVYPRNYLVMAVLLAVCAIYAYFVVNGTEQDRPMYCIVILCCLLMTVFQWYNPRKIRKNLLLAVREIENDRYQLTVYPEYLEIGTLLEETLPEDTESPENPDASDNFDDLFDDLPEQNFSGTRIYINKSLYVREYPEFFMIYQKKVMFYTVPKSVFSEEELEIMRIHFSQRLDKNFSKTD